LVETLSTAARSDEYALVREAAARAIQKLSSDVAVPLLRELASKDPEPRVRETAAELLKAASP
jgi:HEAT repeat protein